MRIFAVPFIALGFLVGCGPSQMAQNDPSLAGSTGFFNKDHIDFIHNGDAYVAKRQREMEAHPEAQTTTPANVQLNAHLKQFEMARFNADQANRPALFGTAKFEIKVFFTDRQPIVFAGRFDAGLGFSTVAEGYRLDGSFHDFRSASLSAFEPLDRTTGVLHLTQLSDKGTVEISYRGLRKKHVVFKPQDEKLSPALEAQVEQIEKTSLWENNWTIVAASGGKSFFLNDFILPDHAATTGPLLAFAGQSLRTSAKDQAYTFQANSLTKETAPEVTLVGNSEAGGKRAYQIALRDPATNSSSEIFVYTEPENADPADVSDGATAPREEASPDLDNDSGVGGDTSATSPATTKVTTSNHKSAARPPRPPNQAIGSSGPYLALNTNLALSQRLDHDIELNRNVPGVLRAIVGWQHNHDKGADRRRLQNFFDYADPFRTLMSAIAQAYDANPIYVYLAVDESFYFTHGTYEIDPGDSGEALGPFQFHKKAAHDMGISLSPDHRVYFSTSACGAARYLSSIVSSYAKMKMDTTLALMGYNQGATGALNYAKKFGVRWNLLDGAGAGLPEAVRLYVNSKLAIYFIANDRAAYGFPLAGPHLQTELPDHTVFPKISEIADPTCRQIVTAYKKR